MPVISVIPMMGQVQVTDAYDVAYASGDKFAIESRLPNGSVLRGLAKTPVGYQLRMSGRGTYSCYEPQTIEVVVGLITTIQIAVDARYYPNSCNYQAILDHENQHVAIARAAVAAHAGEVRAAVEMAVQQSLPSLAFTANAAEVLKARIEQAVVSGLNGVQQEMASRNAELDSPQSYQMTQSLCPSW